MGKLIKSRRAYSCYNCKGDIERGALYARRKVTLGNPRHIEPAQGGGFIQHGVTYDVKYCEQCSGAES
jgi:hypothetical protein